MREIQQNVEVFERIRTLPGNMLKYASAVRLTASSEDWRILSSIFFRYFCYTGLVLMTLSLLPYAASTDGADAFKEGGLVEWVQFGLITFSALLFAFSAIYTKGRRELFLMFALLAAFAAIREQNNRLDHLLPFQGWKGPAALVIALFALHFWFHREAIGKQLRRHISSASFGILWSGFVITVCFAQLVGHAHFLRSLMGDHYDRDYKRVIEETCEAVGYFLIFVGTLEATRRGRSEMEDDLEDDEDLNNPGRRFNS